MTGTPWLPTPSAAQRDWIEHTVMLYQQRCRKPNGLSVDQLRFLSWLKTVMEHVWQCIQARRALEDRADQIVAGYLLDKADLQIARQQRAADEAAFYRQSEILRETLVEQIRDLRGVRDGFYA